MGDTKIKTISEIIEDISPYYKNKKEKGPESMHIIGHDSSSETLEPLYFWILDQFETRKLSPEKLVDNFSSTPGSGHFAELGQRATIMQQQAGKILGDVNTVLRSVLNILYDLKDFKTRLREYDFLKSKKKDEQEAAMLSLKQIWLDKVDMGKGNSSIKAMAFGQAGFQTLIDAFLVVKDESLKGEDGKEIDLNDRIKRILKPRIQEFNTWVKESEKELKKRYELEKTYLKSQVNSLQLYSRWAKPYLKAAQDLEQKESNNSASLVKTFNTIVLELTLLGKTELKIKDEVAKGTLSEQFARDSFLKRQKRKYYGCILVDFTFRGIPQRASAQQSHYVFGGKADIILKSYVLNDEELAKLKQELKKSELNDVLSLIEGTTTESLEKMQKEIDEFLEDKPEEEKKSKDESNPFLALIGKYEEKPKAEKKDKSKKGPEKEIIVAPENWVEKTYLRPLATSNIVDYMFDFFDVYKKAHGMLSYT